MFATRTSSRADLAMAWTSVVSSRAELAMTEPSGCDQGRRGTKDTT
jgi:hypothetical protein